MNVYIFVKMNEWARIFYWWYIAPNSLGLYYFNVPIKVYLVTWSNLFLTIVSKKSLRFYLLSTIFRVTRLTQKKSKMIKIRKQRETLGFMAPLGCPSKNLPLSQCLYNNHALHKRRKIPNKKFKRIKRIRFVWNLTDILWLL